MNFFNRLFGRDVAEQSTPRSGSKDKPVDMPVDSSKRKFSDRYFDTMSQMERAISINDFEDAARLIRLNLQYIQGWVKDTFREYGTFDIGTIPALQQGGRILALVGDEDGLLQMGEVVGSISELEPWTGYVERHRKDLGLFKAILEAISNHPNCLQTDVKGLVGEEDGRLVATLISYLERASKITRTKEGRTYRLISNTSPDAPQPPPKRIVGSHRQDQKPPEMQELNLSDLSYVPLPRAPSRWDEAERGREAAKSPEPDSHFEVRDTDWRLEAIENIPLTERPDPAFRQIHPSDSGLLMIDDLGNAEGLGSIVAAALRYDRYGNVAAKSALQHDTYRVGVHPLGSSLIAMSRDCVIHAYDDRLELIFETALREAPEILALRKRFGISDDALKNHIRCVALSRDEGRYLFTAVDEAWCVDTDGKCLWGVKLPYKEGWRRVAEPSVEFQTSEEVQDALKVMGLSLPIVPEDVKRRFRELAKQWHPDVNRSDDQAHIKMTALNLAAETLTGIDVSSIPSYAGASFAQEERISEFEIGGVKVTLSMEMEAGEVHVADWIYASCFAASSGSVYLAGYSGRVIQVDEYGKGIRAYDIGSVPRRIIDTGDYLYILTDTRLYILKDDALIALIDTFEAGELIVAQTGFALMEKKRLRWFREDGRYLGSVLSKDPIRRVYSSNNRMVLETRQRRAVVLGVEGFWE